LDHIEVKCTAIEGLLLNSAEEHTGSREVEIEYLFWWHESNFLDGETKFFMGRHLVDIDTLSMSLIGEVFLTWLKFLQSIGMNCELRVLWLPVNTKELVNSSLNLNLLMRNRSLELRCFEEFNAIFGLLVEGILVHDSKMSTLRVEVHCQSLGVLYWFNMELLSVWDLHESDERITTGLWERGVDNDGSNWRPSEIFKSINGDGNLVTIEILTHLHRWELIATNESLGNFRLFFLGFTFLSFFSNNLCGHLGDILTVMRPLEGFGVFSEILLEVSDFLATHEIPDGVWSVVSWLIEEDVSFTWREDSVFNLWLVDSKNWGHLGTTDELNLFTLDENKVSSFWTPGECLIRMEVIADGLSLVISEIPKDLGLTLKFVDNNFLIGLESILVVSGFESLMVQFEVISLIWSFVFLGHVDLLQKFLIVWECHSRESTLFIKLITIEGTS